MRPGARPLGTLLLLLASALPLRADAPVPQGTIAVTLGDGSTLTLRNWTLSYEYAIFRANQSPLEAPRARKEGAVVLVGKKELKTEGQVLSFNYQPVPRALIDAGTATEADRFKRPLEIVLSKPGGKPTVYKIEPPNKDLLNDDPPPGTSVTARTLDLRGETVTGSKRDFCLISYTAAVECGGSAADAVVKIEFQQ